jgi:hypothetical protein
MFSNTSVGKPTAITGGQHEVAAQIRGIEDQDDRVGFTSAGHFAAQHANRNALVLRFGAETVNAGQIDQGNFFLIVIAHGSEMLLDSDAGEIRYLLAQTG